MTTNTSSAKAEGLPHETRTTIGRAHDIINRADHLVELINMAAESSQITGDACNAIAWCCVHIRELLDQAGDVLTAVTKQKGSALSELLAVHADLTAAINRHEGGVEDPEVVALMERNYKNALMILGYRPSTDEESRLKAEFLRQWTDGCLLNEEEQKALIVSMLPEGGAA